LSQLLGVCKLVGASTAELAECQTPQQQLVVLAFVIVISHNFIIREFDGLGRSLPPGTEAGEAAEAEPALVAECVIQHTVSSIEHVQE